MPVLTAQQRKSLEDAVKAARRLAEAGARNALQALAVNNSEPYAHMTAEQRALRNRLRSKARLLGDELLANGVQQIDHLSYELAYEYWHKMLFAKFLESNSLLMHPDGVAVTMEECEELAKEEGYMDKWDAAANYASAMLPAIFRTEDPLMQVQFATEDRINLETFLERIDDYTFAADDALGWVYQFWQSEAKKRIEKEEKSGQKIDSERLPAKTQLFTEPYMVQFLIDNTIGAWWVSRHPKEKPPVEFEYLRRLDDGTPAAGKFEGWGDTTKGITCMDPCMGSGHFVVSLFLVLVKLRMIEEGLNNEEATDKVISENLHGLELDARCTQIAAFNLALTAWKFCGYYRLLPEMNLACSGIAPKGRKEDWLKLISKEQDNEKKQRLQNGLIILYEQFQMAPALGSLLDPTTIKADAFTAGFRELQPALYEALKKDDDPELHERGVVAMGIAKAGRLLANKYILQITNVPYLGKSKQDEVLIDYTLKNYSVARSDLATVFFERLLKASEDFGVVCSVLPQNWLFLTTYRMYREKILKHYSWLFTVRLGEHAFESSEAAGAFACMVAIAKRKPSKEHTFFGLNAANNRSEKPIYASEKRELIKTTDIKLLNQLAQSSNPDSRIVIDENVEGHLLSKYAKALQGIATGDFSRYGRSFWEIKRVDSQTWIYQQTTFQTKGEFVGKENIIFWEKGNGELFHSPGARIQGLNSRERKGIAITQMSVLGATVNLSTIFDNNVSVLLPDKDEYLLPIYAFCTSSEYNESVRKVDQKVSVTNATLVKVPFDLEYWQQKAAEKYPNGFPKPYSDEPTQWLFHGHPIKAKNPLQVSVARLLGYRFPAENDTEMELADEARALINQIKTFDSLTDDDGILCIPSVNGELEASKRLRFYLQEVFGKDWNNNTITELLQKEGSKKSNLNDWLRDEFFEHHCKVFNNRPFIWHIWDGRKDGFSALVDYHKLNKEALERLIYAYLGDWILQCEQNKKEGISGAEGLLCAAKNLKEKLEAILEGESPFDIFVRWKPIEKQPIGWEPDLNDGVRLNIRPFITADVLRKKPNIKWGVDRGKNPPGSPWGEVRDNDRHLTLDEKRKEREKV